MDNIRIACDLGTTVNTHTCTHARTHTHTHNTKQHNTHKYL